MFRPPSFCTRTLVPSIRRLRWYPSPQIRHKSRRRTLPGFQPSAEEAVQNILHISPSSAKPQATHQRHVLNCLAENDIGVISSASSILANSKCNIQSLVAAHTEVPGLSRMTIVFDNSESKNIMKDITQQLHSISAVWAILDYTHTSRIERELLLIRISTLGPDHLHTQMPGSANEDKEDKAAHETENSTEDVDINHPQLQTSARLRETFSYLRAITELTRLFEGKIVDVSAESVIVELSAKPSRITSFIRLCKPFGVLEATRTGIMAMPRAPISDYNMEKKNDKDYDEHQVDATSLPPG